MPVKTEKDLSDQLRGYWLKAVTAVELRNFGYAISLLQQLLRQEPEFLTGRQMLRRSEATKNNTAKKRFFNISTASISAIKAQREMKKDPKGAIEMIEKILEEEPYHQQANLLLKEAAVAAGYPEIGIFALQTLLEKKPKDLKVLHQLGRLYHQLEESEKEVEIYNRIAEIDPTDLDAIKLGKDASARSSMKRGGWTEAQSYRDLIKDKEMAVSLEQESRMQLTGEALEQQIAEVYARHQTEPQNLDWARRLGMLHEQKDDYDGALAWFQYAVELTQGTDPGLVRKVSDLKMMQLDRKIRAGEELIAQAGGPEEAQNVGELEAAKKQRAELLISDARKRLDRNPTDPQLRYELGEHLASAGHFREAVPELQRARQSPNARLKAMNLLGRCYRELGMLDLAAKQLEEAAKEMLVMDARKKEIVYNLGLVHEQMGDGTKYIECMKQIYEADYGYKDVAERVESSYAREAEEKEK
jgi:tetratricopeptide (TPR) repeat protein